MAKRRKRAWDMSNPLYRYLHGKRKSRAKRKRTGGEIMAKRRRTSRRSSGLLGGMLGGGSMMNGIVRPKGFLGSAVMGAGAATIADNTGVSNMIPYGKYVAGFAVGGVGGVAGVFIRDMLKGSVTQAISSPYASGY